MNLVLSLFVDNYQINPSDRTNSQYISWSSYDCMSINAAESFRELCMCEVESVKPDVTHWDGVEQKMHLIEIGCNFGTWKLGDKNCMISVQTTTGESKNYKFYCIFSARFSPDIYGLESEEEKSEEKKTYENIVNETIYAELNKISNENATPFPKIVFTQYHSLGVEDTVFIILSDSINDLISAINHIKGIQLNYTEGDTEKTEEALRTVCTFLGMNVPSCDDPIDCDLLLHINLKNSDIFNFKNEVKEVIEDYLIQEDNCNLVINTLFSGKNAASIFIPKNTIKYSIYDINGLINRNNFLFNKYISDCRTYFVTSENNPKTNQGVCIDIHSNLKKKEEEYNDTSITISSSDLYSYRFIKKEYKRMIESSRCIKWIDILKQQFESMEVFTKFYEDKDRLTYCDFLKAMQTSLLHINQACSPACEMPYHNYFYAGSFHDLLKMYYGIIGNLFEFAYKLPHPNKDTSQHIINFAICIDAGSKIRSELYTNNNKCDRFVVFYLPYNSFWNYSENICFLIHEVCHYVAPYSRVVRNEALIDILFKEIVIIITKERFQGDNGYFDYIIPIYTEKIFREYAECKNVMYNSLLLNSNKLLFNSALPELENYFFSKPYTHTFKKIITIISNFSLELLNKNHKKIIDMLKSERQDKIDLIKEFNARYPMSQANLSGLRKTIDNSLSNVHIKDLYLYTQTCLTATKEAHCDKWAIILLYKNK